MSDIKIENAICQAIDIIASKKIAQASFDKTIKCVISSVVNQAIGEYKVSYGDSKNISVYSNNLDVHYKKDDVVYVLIPGNDWNRKKTIINSISDITTNSIKSINDNSNTYNGIGPNLIGGTIDLCSYQSTFRDVYNIESNIEIITVDQTAAKKYIKQGNGLGLGLTVRTALDDSQVGGDYGLIFNLRFKDKVTGAAAIRSYIVGARNVIGNPYSLTSPTPVESFEKEVDVDNFERIQSIQVFCQGFNQNQSITKSDIFFTSPLFKAGVALTDDELSDYSLHIDYATNGDTITSNLKTIKLTAQVKAKGKIINQGIDYYWFRQNGTIFRGDTSGKYSGYAGQGWECLNPVPNKKPVSLKNNDFYFTTKTDYANSTENAALATEKVTKVLCVAVYNNEWIRGEARIFNETAREVYLTSSDIYTDENGEPVNRTVYYLDAGSPNLTCNYSGTTLSNLTYTWSIVSPSGQVTSKEQTKDGKKYVTIENTYNSYINQLKTIAKSQQDSLKSTKPYQNAVSAWNEIKDQERVEGNIYYNVPIKQISGHGKVVCTITQAGNYIGTGSITLYNKSVLQGMYTLNINNGVQIFQYDENGNSPFTKEKDRTALDEIPKLSFTLLDNKGAEVSYDQIIKNGQVNWLFPAYDTLLLTSETDGKVYNDVGLNSADKALAAGLYNIYKKRQTFSYSIEDRFSGTKVNNDIKLVVKYKDLILQAYTTFTFPKNGDPGTNGTDYVAVIDPNPSSDRVYISKQGNNSQVYNDSGAKVDKLNFLLYNNNSTVATGSLFWSCPPIVTSGDTSRGNTYLNINSTTGVPSLNSSASTAIATVKNNKPINIIRGKCKVDNLECFAECPINYVYINKAGYRIKIKPKTGFKYVVYKEDGTRPEYDNSKPFEIIVEKQRSIDGIAYYSTSDLGTITVTWSTIGNIAIEGTGNTGLRRYFKPGVIFDGSDLTTAIIAQVKENNTYIGFIHIPIYMLLNRYGHNAINGWDGNSIQINDNEIILAPQVGAGRKNGANAFTGVVIGSVKPNNSTKIEDGLFGYNQGVRTIFLDAQNGNAHFGKNNGARINIGASKVGIAPQGSIYSGNYYNYDDNGLPKTEKGQGLLIDLTKPEIKFGSGNFSVDKDGNMTAKGNGTIAGWKIGTDKLTSTNNKVYLQSGNYTTAAPYAIYSNNTFTVTPDGYLVSKSGNIAGWNITTSSLSKNKVGMNSNPGTNNTSKAFYAGDNFYVRHDGYLYSTSGTIGGWNITKDDLNKTSGNGKISLSPNSGISLSSVNDSTKYFKVDNQGKIDSTSGTIGGWTIEKDKIYAGDKNTGLRLLSNGSIQGGKQTGNGSHWSISSDGSATFNGITANNATVTGDITANTLNANNGKIGGWNISSEGLYNNYIWISSGNEGGIGAANNKWTISANGNAYFDNITAHGKISGTIDTQGLSGGSISGSTLSGNNFNPYSNTYPGYGGSVGKWVDDEINAVKITAQNLVVEEEARIKNLIITGFRHDGTGQRVTWATINPITAYTSGTYLLPTAISSDGKITSYSRVSVVNSITRELGNIQVLRLI